MAGGRKPKRMADICDALVGKFQQLGCSIEFALGNKGANRDSGLFFETAAETAAIHPDSCCKLAKLSLLM